VKAVDYMKYLFVFSLLINVSYAQTGIKTTPPEKRVLICCGKATNITTAPAVTPVSTTKSSTGSKH
jgi:hypothetical protein